MNSLDKKDLEVLEKTIIKFLEYLKISQIYDLTNTKYMNNQINSITKRVHSLDVDISDSMIICDNRLNINSNVLKNNTVIKLFDENGFYLNNTNSKTKVSIHGKYIDYDKTDVSNFKVLAIMHVYNEEDIIRQSVEHILSQGIDVYLLDNWSKDNTANIINELAHKYPNRVFVEKYPSDHDNNCYDWKNQLKKSEELSKSLNYDWFIHYDADECRISPLKNVSLKEFIYMVDRLGFNLIENTLINFKLTDSNQSNIFMKDTYFEFGNTPGSFVQLKTWKKSNEIDLNTSGGHVAEINNPKIYPLKILNKHYPFRTMNQARQKIFFDRKPRYKEEERNIGWHTQYDSINNYKDFINLNKTNLIYWDDNTINDYYPRLFIDARL